MLDEEYLRRLEARHRKWNRLLIPYLCVSLLAIFILLWGAKSHPGDPGWHTAIKVTFLAIALGTVVISGIIAREVPNSKA